LTITTTGGDQILSTHLSYSLTDGFTDLRQIRISGTALIPEASAVTMLATGLGMTAALRLRRPRRARSA
jgi:hypothetical protein